MIPHRLRMILLGLPLLLVSAGLASAEPRASSAENRFAVHVIDADTGRSVPLVELRTTNSVRYFTDSDGWAAIDEPGLMGRRVFFHVRSHGYRYPADGFGSRGKALELTPGGSATLEVERINIAERLYRVTGQGIYHHSVRLGKETPTRDPLLSGGVMGQDSVQAAVYRDRIYWFWGDTGLPHYPLGNFQTSGATSELPDRGGLDPTAGVDMEYFVDDEGRSRPMVPLEEPGVVWIDGVLTVEDPNGETRLVTHYARLRGLGEPLGHGLAVYNDQTQRFERHAKWPDDTPLYSNPGHPVRVETDGRAYYYFASPYPLVRVQADWEHVTDPAAYETFTCLKQGSRFDPDAPELDRDDEGRLVYAWKPDTAAVDGERQRELIENGFMEADEAWLTTRDVETGEPITLHGGSVRWNEYRQRWIMIAVEIGGSSSFLGEVWYAEADQPHGPWPKAAKIATHDQYSFYNPVHHAFFDQDGGRTIYFQGTYTHTFSDTETPTPRYDYNQIMYRLDLTDPRLEAAH